MTASIERMGIDFDPGQRQAIAAEVNLSVLRRADSAVESILSSASHVALYELNEESSWRRCDTEGSLFVVKRQVTRGEQSSAYRIVICNRKSLRNYIDDLIVGNKDVEHTDQMIMYCNASGVTVGIWFFEPQEALSTFRVLQKILNGEHVPAEPAPRQKRPQKRSQPQKSPVQRGLQQKGPAQKTSTSPKGSGPRSATQKGAPPQKNQSAQKGPTAQKGSAAQRGPASQKGPTSQRQGLGTQKGPARKEPSKPRSVPSKAPAQSQASPAGSGDISVPPPQTETMFPGSISAPQPDDSLTRFFPNLCLTDGVAGEAVPEDAHSSSLVESEAAKTFEPTAEIDGAIVHASETGKPENVLAQLMTAPKPDDAFSAESAEKVLGELMGAANAAQMASVGMPNGVSRPAAPASPPMEPEVTPVVDLSQTPKLSPQPTVQPEQRKQQSQPKRPAQPVAPFQREKPKPSPAHTKPAKEIVVSRGVQAESTVAPAAASSSSAGLSIAAGPSSPPSIPASVPQGREADEANRRMQQAMMVQNMQMQEARMREMQSYRFNSANDVPVSAPKQMLGNGIAAGVIAPPGGLPIPPPVSGMMPPPPIPGLPPPIPGMPPVPGMVPPSMAGMPPPSMAGMPPPPPGLFGGVHPQMAMMMHQQQYQLYLQQQYMANVHQRQMQSQGMPQPAVGHQRHYEPMQRQTQQQRNSQGIGDSGDGNVNIGSGSMDGLVSSSTDLMRMLNVGQSPMVDTSRTLSKKQDVDSAAIGIGSGMRAVERAGLVGSLNGGRLDRASFRAVLQRMLTDRKLFECVYDHYLGSSE